jgi:hypothetical protein
LLKLKEPTGNSRYFRSRNQKLPLNFGGAQAASSAAALHDHNQTPRTTNQSNSSLILKKVNKMVITMDNHILKAKQH